MKTHKSALLPAILCDVGPYSTRHGVSHGLLLPPPPKASALEATDSKNINLSSTADDHQSETRSRTRRPVRAVGRRWRCQGGLLEAVASPLLLHQHLEANCTANCADRCFEK